MKKIMIIIGILALLILAVSCKEQTPEEPVDEPITQAESLEIAKSMVETSPEYMGDNGRNLEHVETTAGECDTCWFFKFTFTRDFQEKTQQAEFIVDIRNGEMMEIKKTFTDITLTPPTPPEDIEGMACEADSDCVDTSGMVGVTWVCEENKCVKKPFGNPAAMKCEEDGGTAKTVTSEDGSQTGYCIFDDNSVCGSWAYFRGECEPGTFMEEPYDLETEEDVAIFALQKWSGEDNLIFNFLKCITITIEEDVDNWKVYCSMQNTDDLYVLDKEGNVLDESHETIDV